MIDNHIDALDTAILIDRKKGEFYTLEHVAKGIFYAELCGSYPNQVRKYKSALITLKKITSGLACKRYRILEVKN